MTELATAMRKAMPEFDRLAKCARDEPSPLHEALGACSERHAPRMSDYMRSLAPSTMKGVLSVGHRLCAWLVEQRIDRLPEVTVEVIAANLKAAIAADASATGLPHLKNGWLHLCRFAQRGLTDDEWLSSIMKAHKRKEGKPAQGAAPLFVRDLLRVAAHIGQSPTFNEKNIFSFLIFAFFGTCRFSHLYRARWSDLTILDTQPARVVVLKHSDGQKQSGADVRCQTSCTDAPWPLSLSHRLDELSDEQTAEDWPFLFAMGTGAAPKQLTVDAVNGQLKDWLRQLAYPNWSDYSSHSARRGSVTAAFSARVEDGVIRDAGKWLGSTAYRAYNETRYMAGVTMSATLINESVEGRAGLDAMRLRKDAEDLLWQETAPQRTDATLRRSTKGTGAKQPCNEDRAAVQVAKVGEVPFNCVDYVRHRLQLNRARDMERSTRTCRTEVTAAPRSHA